jgi:hypothetical protein
MATENQILEKMLENAVNWVTQANADIPFWEGVRAAAKKDAKDVRDLDDDADERDFSERKADASSHMADVALNSTSETRRVALEELGKVQDEYVEDITVEQVEGKDEVFAKVIVKKGRKIPTAFRFFWYANDATISQGTDSKGNPDKQYISVGIDTSELPDGDTPIEAILGFIGALPLLKDYK